MPELSFDELLFFNKKEAALPLYKTLKEAVLTNRGQATITLYLGYSIKDIPTWLEHSNYVFTASTYVHSSMDSHMQVPQSMSENLPTSGPAITTSNMDFPMLEASFSGSKT